MTSTTSTPKYGHSGERMPLPDDGPDLSNPLRLTPRGKRAAYAGGAVLAGAAVAGGLLLPLQTPPSAERVTAPEVSDNLNRLTGNNPMTQFDAEEQTIPAGFNVYAGPDTDSVVRFTVGEGKLAGKVLKINLAGIVGGDADNQHVWEAFEAPEGTVDATSPASTTLGKAERMVYIPVDSLDDMPHNVVNATYMSVGDGGYFQNGGGIGSDGKPQGADQQINALSAVAIKQ